jgi:hypothetical protein
MKATHSIESGSSVTTTRVSAGTLVDNWMDPPSRQLTWRVSQLSRALDEFGTYIDDNAGAIVNYGERRHCEAIREEAADAMDAARRTLTTAGASACPQ